MLSLAICLAPVALPDAHNTLDGAQPPAPTAVGHLKLVIKGGQVQPLSLPSNPARVVFRAVNLVKESALTNNGMDQTRRLDGQGQVTFNSVSAVY